MLRCSGSVGWYRYLHKLAADAGIPVLVLQKVKSAATAAGGGGAEEEHIKLQALLLEHASKLTQASIDQLQSIATEAGVDPSDIAEAISKRRELGLLLLIADLGVSRIGLVFHS